ncbi:transposase [Streptomyces cavernae]|uniref:transposase n=1 Tax=Streptomyces cavernae TaxID=2259034 RepID=UPI0013907AD8|nr:transposase [Streptomyces cavernae]
MTTRPWIVDDASWALIEPLLPPWPNRSPGPVDDRPGLQGILYVLPHDIAWQLLPLSLEFGTGSPRRRRRTCRRRCTRQSMPAEVIPRPEGDTITAHHTAPATGSVSMASSSAYPPICSGPSGAMSLCSTHRMPCRRSRSGTGRGPGASRARAAAAW